MPRRFQILILIFFPCILTAQPQVLQLNLSANPVAQYALVEINPVLQASYTNPYDPQQIDLKAVFLAPDGDSMVVAGFFMQPYDLPAPDQAIASGPPVWRIRFSPDKPGNWQFRLRVTDTSGSTLTPWDTFLCTPSAHPGFVRGSAGQYFVQDNGECFITLGENMAWGVPEGKFAPYERWMDSLANNGANFIKIMMVPWAFSIEGGTNGPGDYSARQDRARHLDWVLELARARNIRVQLAFMIHDVLSTNWSNHWATNPYNQINGGPCATVTQFFTDEGAKRHFKNYLRYSVARWSAYPEIIAWEVISEGDNVENYSQIKTEVSAWLQEMNTWIHATDPWQRPITAGFASSVNDPDYWNHPFTSFTQLHLYDDYPDFEKEVYDWSRTYLDKYPRPFIIGEMGLSHSPDTIVKYDPEGIAFRNAIWTTMLSGALGCGMHWWWDNYIDPQALYHHFRGPAALLNNGPAPDSTWQPARPELITTNTDTLILVPGFQQLFMMAPANLFTVEPGGFLEPSVRMLGAFLYGKGSMVSSFRNPPSFDANFHSNGTFTIITGNYVVSSTLQVNIDGIPAWSQVVQANAEYSIPIPAGRHLLLVENISTDNGGCEISSYAFHPFLSEARSFALLGNEGGIGWMQRQDFHWQKWYAAGGSFPLVENAVLVIPGFTDSLYTIHWIDPWSGQELSSALLYPSGDTLLADVPDFAPDLAFWLAAGNTLGTDPVQELTVGSFSVFPNPSIGMLSFNLDIPVSGKVEIVVYDSSGRAVYAPFQGFLPAGKHRINWSEGTESLTPGLYIARASVPGGMMVFKIIRQ